MYRTIYYDENGVPRVYGDGTTQQEALSNATEELYEYRKQRPELRSYKFITLPKENLAGWSVRIQNLN